MKKAIIAASLAALIAGSATTLAAQDRSDRAERWRPSMEDRAALTDARIAGLKAGLKLTPEQEKLWPAVEGALRDAAKDRQARMQQARQAREANKGERPDPIARMRAAADRMDAAAGDLRKIASAADPLYKSLDDAQKNRLNLLIRQNMRHMNGGPDGPGGPGGRGPQRG